MSMALQSRSNMSDSWIVNSEDDGNISWAEDSEHSDSGILPKQYRSVSTTKAAAVAGQRRVTSRNVSASSGPQFVMPSIEHRPSPPIPQQDRQQLRTPNQTPSKRDITSSSARNKPTQRRRQESRTSKHDASTIVMQVVDYLLDILGSSLKKLKQPISWALAAYMFAGMVMLVQNFLTSSISAAFSPVCRIPGVSYLRLPICTYTSRYPSELQKDDVPTIQSSSDSKAGASSKDGKSEPEFDALMHVQSQFDALLTESSSQSVITLPLDMKRSETSMRDLRQIVRFSAIPSKNELLHEFDGFVETARIASYDLQKFNSHVGRAVDNVLSTAKWTGRVLDEIATNRQNRGLLPAFIQDTILAPFQPVQFDDARVLEQYIVHSRMVSDEIGRLVDEAQGLLLILSNLEDRLDVIHGISLRDNLAAKADRDEVLSDLWTFFGGNRKKLGKVDNQLKLLGRVAEYRKMAYAHVSSTVVKLQGMGAELEELRSRVGAAEVLRDSGRGVPLDVHLEAIRMGVERLEGQREKAREVERGYARRVVDAGQHILGEADGVKLLADN